MNTLHISSRTKCISSSDYFVFNVTELNSGQNVFLNDLPSDCSHLVFDRTVSWVVTYVLKEHVCLYNCLVSESRKQQIVQYIPRGHN